MSPKYLVDESLSRELARRLRAVGLDAVDCRDVGLRGAPDPEILDWARANDRALVTGDVGSGDVRRYSLGSHPGIVLVRPPSGARADDFAPAVARAVASLVPADVRGHLVVFDGRRIRIRRPG